MVPLKFYYIDEEQELISINCQSDFVEAVEFCDEILKLTVATNVQMARQQMVRNIDDNTSLAESLNQSSGFISQRSSYRMRSGTSDFEDLTKEQEASTARVPFHKPLETKPIVHEMAVGSENVHMKAVDIGTDVRNLIPKIDIATVTQNVGLKDTNTNTCQEYSAASSQVEIPTSDVGCDGLPSVNFANQANGTMINQIDADTHCQILVPDSEESGEEAIEEQINCFKCRGSQINKKGLPCRKCNGTGVFSAKGLKEVSKLVREEITDYCTG
jgi:PB1 domain